MITPIIYDFSLIESNNDFWSIFIRHPPNTYVIETQGKFCVFVRQGQWISDEKLRRNNWRGKARSIRMDVPRSLEAVKRAHSIRHSGTFTSCWPNIRFYWFPLSHQLKKGNWNQLEGSRVRTNIERFLCNEKIANHGDRRYLQLSTFFRILKRIICFIRIGLETMSWSHYLRTKMDCHTGALSPDLSTITWEKNVINRRKSESLTQNWSPLFFSNKYTNKLPISFRRTFFSFANIEPKSS